MKKRLLFIVLFYSFFGFSQNPVLNLPVNYKSEFYRDKESLALINESKSELVLFIEDHKKTKLVLLNSDLEVKSEFQIETLPKSFKNYLGYKVNKDNSYSVFFTNLKNKKFGRLDINFETKESSVHKLDFTFNFEGYVETLMFNNEFYLISVTKRSNDVHFYIYNNNGNFDKKTVSFDFLERKVNSSNKKASNILFGSKLAKIDVSLPNAIELTANENKIYLNNDEFIFTFDNDKNSTIVAKLDPTNFNIKHDVFKHSVVTLHQFSKHNSYLFDNKLYQISGSAEELKFTIKDFRTKELIKNIVLNKSDSITFKNTPIILEGVGFNGDKTKEIEKTNKFLRKISKDKIGVSVLRQNENLKILLGGEIINYSGGASMPGFGGIPLGGFGPLSVSFNPTFSAYGNYVSSRSTYIGCLFDKDFNHVKGEIEKNSLDKVKDFEDSFDNKSIYTPKAKLTNVFSFNNKLYFGYLNTEDKNYHLIEFEK
ncbi:hypothetical protein [Algibacter sp. Ld11]|uniref:hypothetical protein n=1 Tax=Algibacter sp. Ld11 TaxID=649150 RepID=UPI003864857C